MAIIKPGFKVGFRGRKQQASWKRRGHYLASEHNREKARLLDIEGRPLVPEQAIEVMGGPDAEYHEIIVAPSAAECRTILERVPEDRDRAIEEAGRRILKAYAEGKPALLAIHEQDGRFHFHLAVKGPQPERALGKDGTVQRHWNREVFGDEPRILDWDAHQRFRAQKTELLSLLPRQRENDRARIEALRGVPLIRQAEIARPYEQRARSFIVERHRLEVACLAARYEARGMSGSPRHLAELEAVAFRRTGALRRLDRRELGRDLATGRFRTQHTLNLVGGASRRAADGALRDLGVPAPLRVAATTGLRLTQEVVQASVKVAFEASKTVAREGVRVSTLAVEAATSAPTAGASRVANLAVEGAIELGRAVTSAATRKAPLPEPVKRAFEIAGYVPVAGTVAKAYQLAVELTWAASSVRTNDMEINR